MVNPSRLAIAVKCLETGCKISSSIAVAYPRARAFFVRYPKAAYMTEIESWRVLSDDEIEFTMRRLPSAD